MEQKKMNMISTGAFLNEMDASSKQPKLAEKFAAVWEKKNANAARAGGVSLMALSLAACGSSSSTTTSSTTTTTTTTSTAADTIALTAGPDSATGGAGDTTINALTDGHLEAGDSITGGAGDDTLVIRDYDTSAGSFTMSGVETININFATTGQSLDLTDVTGLTSLIIDASVATNTVSAVEKAHALTLANIASGVTTINVDFSDGEFDGTDDTYSLTLDDVDDALTLSLDSVGASVEAIENLTIATGSNDNGGVITISDEGANAETVTISGAADAKISGLTSGTVTASAMTGDLTLTMSAEESTITGGAGDDVIVMGSTLTYEDTIDGGAGTNTLAIDDADGGTVISNASSTANAYNVSNIQTLRLDAELTNDATEATIDMGEIAGLTTLIIEDAIDNDNGANNIDVDNLADGSTITLGDADGDIAGGNDTVDLDVTFATNSSANNLTLNLTEGVEVNALTSSDNFIDTATITVADDTIVVNTLSSFTAKTINVTGDQTVTFGTLSTSTTTFDASGATGAVTVVGSATASEITGGSAGDTLTGGGAADIISGGAGDDTIRGEDGADNLTGGAGDDDFVLDDDDSVDTINDFTVGASADQIVIDFSGIDGEAGGNLRDSGGDLANSDTVAFITYTSGTAKAAAAIGAADNFIKVNYDSDIDAFSDIDFAGGNITLDAALDTNDGILAMFYDADGGFANVGYIVDAENSAVIDGTNTSFVSLAQVTMTSDEYGDIVVGNFSIIA
jgi:Ca2+-binding RTX toxin-like protein